MARPKSNGSPNPSTATIGFEATALRGSAMLQGAATLRSLSAAKDNLWLTADKLRNNMDAAEPSGARQTAAGSPKGERGGAHQYFLTRFASTEGKNGGVAKCEVRSANVEVKTTLPFVIRNSLFGISPDPACGSGGMFVQSEKFVESHGGKPRFNSEYALSYFLN